MSDSLEGIIYQQQLSLDDARDEVERLRLELADANRKVATMKHLAKQCEGLVLPSSGVSVLLQEIGRT